MLIIGAGNLGKHVLDILLYDGLLEEVAFYDDRSDIPDLVYGFPVFRDEKTVIDFFKKTGPSFIAAVGNNRLREKVTQRFEKLGGVYVSLISSKACISKLTSLEQPIFIQPFVTLAHHVIAGKGCTLHANSVIGHDVILGNFVSVATLTTLIGPCEIGDYSFIGTQCLVMPGVKIGKHVVVGARSTVRRDLADYETYTET